MKFFRASGPQPDPDTVVIVAEDPEASILLRWVPNTGLWHRVAVLENDYLFGDDGGVYDPISPEQAAELLKAVRPFDERVSSQQRLMSTFRALPVTEQRTNAEMGLSQSMTGLRTMSAPGLAELLRRSRQWRTVGLYGEGVGSAPRQFVSDWSRRDSPLGLPAVQFRIREKAGRPTVQARAVSKTAIRTDEGKAAGDD